MIFTMKGSTGRTWLLAAALVVAFSAVGCGDVYRRMEYETATFTGPASGRYNVMTTGEQYKGSHIQHARVADLCIRLEDGTVYRLSKLRKRDVAQRKYIHCETDSSGMTVCQLHPSNATLHFRKGELVGAVFSYRVELSKDEKGPFVKMPLSAEEVRDLLGKPRRQTTFRGTPKWN